MKRLLIFGLIIVVATACNRVNIDTELAQIDSLQTAISNTELLMNEVDMNEVKTIQEQMSNQIMIAKSLYGDSIEWDKAKLLSRYHRINKSFRKYIDKQLYLTGELEFSHQQLRDLSTDLENNIISPDSFNTYFDKECQAVIELRELIQKEVTKTKTNFDDYQDFSSKIAAMLDGHDEN